MKWWIIAVIVWFVFFCAMKVWVSSSPPAPRITTNQTNQNNIQCKQYFCDMNMFVNRLCKLYKEGKIGPDDIEFDYFTLNCKGDIR